MQAEEDILSYCLFPEVALGYFKWRAQPEGARDPIPADVEMQKSETAESAGGAQVSPEDAKFIAVGKAFAALMATVGGGKVDLSAVKFGEAALSPLQTGGSDKLGEAALSPLQAGGSDKSVASPKDEVPAGTPVLAPLNGTFYRSAGPGKPELAADGAVVKAGDSVCIVEAMKLFNPIKATASGTITFVAKHGAAVTKGETLAVIGA